MSQAPTNDEDATHLSHVPFKKHQKFLLESSATSAAATSVQTSAATSSPQAPPSASTAAVSLPGKKRFLSAQVADSTDVATLPMMASLGSSNSVGVVLSSSNAAVVDVPANAAADEFVPMQSKKHRAFAQFRASDEPTQSTRPSAPHHVLQQQQQQQQFQPPMHSSGPVALSSSTADVPLNITGDDDVGVQPSVGEAQPRPRAENERGQAIYCVCQLPYDGRQMIGCDTCDEWFHLVCIGMSDTRATAMANQKYHCWRCVRDSGVELERRRHKSCRSPTCSNQSRPHSRYCSDQCGIGHAAATIRRERQKESEARERALEERRMNIRRKKAMTAQTRERAALDELQRMINAAQTGSDAQERSVDALRARDVLRRMLDSNNSAEAIAIDDQQASDVELVNAVPLTARYDAQQLMEIEATLRALRVERVLLERRAATARCCARVATRLLSESDAQQSSATAMDNDDAQDENMSSECPTCGKLVGMASYSRHVATCYATQEASQIAASSRPPVSDVTMLCEAFDPKTKLYCKKLKVSCPFHGLAAAPRKAAADEAEPTKAEGKRRGRKAASGRGAAAAETTLLCAFPPALISDAELDRFFVRLIGSSDADDAALATYPPAPSGDEANTAVAVMARLDERLDALQERFDESVLSLDDLQPCRELASSCPRHSNWGLLAEMRLLQEAIRIETDENELRQRAVVSRARIAKRARNNNAAAAVAVAGGGQ